VSGSPDSVKRNPGRGFGVLLHSRANSCRIGSSSRFSSLDDSRRLSLPPEGKAEKGKRAAGVRAAEVVSPDMVLGLGSGSTVAYFLRALARRFQEGELTGIVGVPTSIRTEGEARDLGIPLTTLEAAGALDLTVDGADEVDPELNLIKGMGGALLREKMVAQATRRMVIIVDEAKVVDRLGTRSPLPIEVVPFGWGTHLAFVRGLGADAVVRTGPSGETYETDNGNLILDCHFSEGISDPWALQEALAGRAGVVESGLFLGMAEQVLVGGEEGVRSKTIAEGGDTP
jgi:ribose 5-phosphate isomerase A